MSGRWDRVYSDQERTAILRAVFEDGMSARAAWKAAERGGLYGLPPYKPSLAWVQALVRTERIKREGLDAANLNAVSLQEQAGRMVEKAFQRLEKQHRAGKLTAKELAEWVATARKVEEWVQETRAQRKPEPDDPNERKAAGLLDQLEELANETPSSTAPSFPHLDGGEGPDSANRSDNSKPNHAANGNENATEPTDTTATAPGQNRGGGRIPRRAAESGASGGPGAGSPAAV